MLYHSLRMEKHEIYDILCVQNSFQNPRIDLCACSSQPRVGVCASHHHHNPYDGVVKFRTDPKVPPVFLEITQGTDSISGSVLPLAMFFICGAPLDLCQL